MAGVAHCRVAVDENLRKGMRSLPWKLDSQIHILTYRFPLNVHAVFIHKCKHFEAESFVMVQELKARGAVHWHHFGQVMVVVVRTPDRREERELKGRRILNCQAIKG